MGITPQGARALRDYLDTVIRHGPSKRKIYAALVLTNTQRASIELALRCYWKRPHYACPIRLAIYPLHGYESRVIRDGFSVRQYQTWLEVGCADSALVERDIAGRPYLFVAGIVDASTARYDLVVPIRSDARGHVWIDDVIPKGLWPARK